MFLTYWGNVFDVCYFQSASLIRYIIIWTKIETHTHFLFPLSLLCGCVDSTMLCDIMSLCVSSCVTSPCGRVVAHCEHPSKIELICQHLQDKFKSTLMLKVLIWQVLDLAVWHRKPWLLVCFCPCGRPFHVLLYLFTVSAFICLLHLSSSVCVWHQTRTLVGIYIMLPPLVKKESHLQYLKHLQNPRYLLLCRETSTVTFLEFLRLFTWQPFVHNGLCIMAWNSDWTDKCCPWAQPGLECVWGLLLVKSLFLNLNIFSVHGAVCSTFTLSNFSTSFARQLYMASHARGWENSPLSFPAMVDNSELSDQQAKLPAGTWITHFIAVVLPLHHATVVGLEWSVTTIVTQTDQIWGQLKK